MDLPRPSGGAFRDDPIQDPLALLKEFRATRDRMVETATGSALPRIGFACFWEKIPQRSWSYSAWHLLAALRLVTDTTDIGVHIAPLPRTILRAIHARRRAGRLTTTWNYSRLTDAYIAHALRRELSRNPAARRCDAVLTAFNQGDLAVLSVPFFVYTDVSWDAYAEMIGGACAGAARLLLTPSSLARRRERQLAIYERATGIMVQSRWLARGLVEQTGLPPGKIHVVPPGISAGWQPPDASLATSSSSRQGEHQVRPAPPCRAAPRRRLLYIGARDFHLKGGDLVVAALAVLRREHDPHITLTVAGPQTWPLLGSPPDGVRFLGPLPPHEVSAAL